jgi:addiction module HigA family antidote
MDYIIETPQMGEILLEEFMEPMGISAYKLAQEIHVPVSRIQDILHGRRKVTADTSLRLARYFGVSEKYFLDIQNEIDIRELKQKINAEIQAIHPCKTAIM